MIELLGEAVALSPPHLAHRAFKALDRSGFSLPAQDAAPVVPVVPVGFGVQIARLVLHIGGIVGELLPLGRLAAQKAQVGLSDPVAQHDLGPAVGDDVVGLHQQAGGALSHPAQDEPVQRRVRGEDGDLSIGCGPVAEALFIDAGKVQKRDRVPGHGGVVLHGNTVPHCDPGAQGGVQIDHRTKGFLQQRQIHSARDADGGADVVDGSSPH